MSLWVENEIIKNEIIVKQKSSEIPFYFNIRMQNEIVGGFFDCGMWKNISFIDFCMINFKNDTLPYTFERCYGFNGIGIFNENTLFPMYASDIK